MAFGIATGGTVGTVQDRYQRAWLALKDSRKVRGYDQRSAGRISRDFVDPTNITVTVTRTTDSRGYVSTERTVTGSVGTTGDNVNS